MLHNVGVICFTMSYLIVFFLEIFRCLVRRSFSSFWILLPTFLGFVAHTAYLSHHFLFQNSRLVSGMSGWFFLLAWLLIVCYFYQLIFFPKKSFGLFLLPLVFLLIGTAETVRNVFFSEQVTNHFLRIFHGSVLLIATLLILNGFVTGGMYFLQLKRLKQKSASQKIALPSLERLQQINRRSVKLSIFFLGLGIISGGCLCHTIVATSQQVPPSVPSSAPLVTTHLPSQSSSPLVSSLPSSQQPVSSPASSAEKNTTDPLLSPKSPHVSPPPIAQTSGSSNAPRSFWLSDPMIFGSIFLFVFMILFLIVLSRTRNQYDGRSIAFLTIICFLFLLIIFAMGLLNRTPHRHWSQDAQTPRALPLQSVPSTQQVAPEQSPQPAQSTQAAQSTPSASSLFSSSRPHREAFPPFVSSFPFFLKTYNEA